MGYIAKIIIGILIWWCFAGIISFLPFFIGLLYKFFLLPIHLIDLSIYPVGPLPYISLSAGIVLLIIIFVLSISHKLT